MCPTDLLGTSFADLADRLDAAAALPRWAGREPALAGLDRVADVRRLVHGRQSPRSDGAFGALLRIASRAPDGGGPGGASERDGVDAALLVAHLVEHGVSGLVWSLRELSGEIDTLVAGAVWVLIRTDRWGEGRRGYAKALLCDARKAVVADLRGGARRWGSGWRPGPTLLDPTTVDRRQGGGIDPLSGTPGHPGDPEQELGEVLAWAQRTGVVSAEDIATLIELDLASVEQRRAMAAERGCGERQLRRQRQATLRRLHEARHAYLGVTG